MNNFTPSRSNITSPGSCANKTWPRFTTFTLWSTWITGVLCDLNKYGTKLKSPLFTFVHKSFNTLGYYLYVESSSPRKAGQKADLISPWMKWTPGGQCLKFYYTMYGRTMGSLDVKLELSDGRAWLIFLKKGDQGKDWKKGQGYINIPAGLSYRVRICVTENKGFKRKPKLYCEKVKV